MQIFMQLFAIIFFLFCISINVKASVIVKSPNERLVVTVELLAGQPYYDVKFDGKVILKPSTLGFEFNQQPALSHDFKLIDHEINEVNEVWNPLWGEKAVIANHYNELTVSLQESLNLQRKLAIVFRVYDDGFGFRYHLPEQNNLHTFAITNELTSFRFVDNHKAWWIPADYDSYEHLYRQSKLSEVKAVNTPITLKSDTGLYFAIHEAALTDYAGMTLAKTNRQAGNKVFAEKLTLTSELVPWPDGIKVKGKTPFYTPWRTVQVAETLAALVQSDLIVNLNEPNIITDTSWIKPMKYVGVWWGMHMRQYTWHAGPKHGATTENTKRYMDFASQNGIAGVLVEGWNLGWETWHSGQNKQDFTKAYPDFDLAEVVRYGNEKGVALIGHHETGGNIALYEQQMEQAFKYYHDHGVTAVKTGYAGKMHPNGQYHHGQFMVNHYRKVLEIAAKYKIMVNAHEPIKPTGIRRTLPNMMTREGARGMEWNGWSEGNPPEHTVTLPFTRLLAGPLDYTPGIFNIQFDPQGQYRVHSTLARQLAMFVTLYSPMQMAADMIENYVQQPAFELIKAIPVSWDDSLLLAGEIGDYVSIARQKGAEWFVGTLTDEQPRTVDVKLDFLEENTPYIAVIYSDALTTDFVENPTAMDIKRYSVARNDVIQVTMASGGGQTMHIYPTPLHHLSIPDQHSTKLPNSNTFNMLSEIKSKRFQAGRKFGEVTTKAHLAVGKPIIYHTCFDDSYSAGGEAALVDGILGGADYKSLWQGFRRRDLDITIDLEAPTRVKRISIGFLQSVLHSILLPEKVRFFASTNGKKYVLINEQAYESQKNMPDYQRKRFHIQMTPMDARYIKIQAENVSQLPNWHIRKGQEAFIFADEVIVE